MSEQANHTLHHSDRLILKRIEKGATIRSKKYGTLRLRFLSVNDWEFLLKLLPEPITDREFVIRFLEHQLVPREEDSVTVALFPDRLLLHMVSRWAKNELSERQTQSVTVKDFAGFRLLVRSYLDRQNAKIRDTLQQLSNTTSQLMQSYVGAFGNTIFQESLLQIRQSLVEIPRVPHDFASQFNTLFQQTFIGLAQTEKVLADVCLDFSRIIQAADIRNGIIQMMTDLMPAMSGFQEMNISIARISAAFYNLPKTNLQVISQTSYETSKSIAEAFFLWKLDLPDLLASAAAPKGFEAVQRTSGRLIPLLPDAAEVHAYRSGAYDDTLLFEERRSDHIIAFDSELDVFLINLIKNADLYDKEQIDPYAWRKTCSKQFYKNISHAFELSPTIHPRIRNLEDALTAHKQSTFSLSVPAFFIMLEGILTDLLIVKNHMIRKGSKVMDPSSGRELTGLAAKITTYESIYPGHPTVSKLTHFMKTWVSPTRNTVLHGAPTTDYTEEVSTWLILIIYYLAWQLGTFEREMLLK